METVWLTLADGTRWRGNAPFGLKAALDGEVVFSTSMGGYAQSLSDPSYCGQMLVFTFPSQGIYGVDADALEGIRPWVSAAVVQGLESTPLPGVRQLGEWLAEWNVPLVTGVDCRNLVLRLRERGTLMGRLARDPEAPRLQVLPDSLVRTVTCSETSAAGGDGPTVVLVDYGVKRNILRSLENRGCRVIRVPASTTAEEILAWNPAGVVLSNGPGDPAVLREETAVVTHLLGKVPLFGICLGTQLLAQACGARTAKLPYGHRGTNQPVLHLESRRGYVTSQNHGYAVVEETLDGAGLFATFRHLGDGTVEGIASRNVPAWGVQFHPEACPGPRDTTFLFDSFLQHLAKEASHDA